MTSLSAKARKVKWFVDMIVIEKKGVNNAYLQWKNVKNVNEREPEILCIECPAFINIKNISNTLKFPSAILEDF